MKDQTKVLFQLFWSFFKISPVTFGGGFAMIPLIEKEVVEKHQWIKREDVTDVFAVAQTVPGSSAINAATFVGHRIAGIKGAIAAMIGSSIPTFFIVLVLAAFYKFFENHPKVEAAFVSIRITIVALIVFAAIKIIKTAIIDKSTFSMFVLGVPALFFIHPILAIASGALLGIGTVALKIKLGKKIELERKKSNKDKDDYGYFMGAGI
ncbi:chromate transporter [Bacillus massiliglaciei]|uniref:chromate transporter n=1 Tax=Bacillus massiliglaciei TaxID=1816693 RepID=UPI000AD00A39|nr:chromate transporter [Bacillus massiliglaciei]